MSSLKLTDVAFGSVGFDILAALDLVSIETEMNNIFGLAAFSFDVLDVTSVTTTTTDAFGLLSATGRATDQLIVGDYSLFRQDTLSDAVVGFGSMVFTEATLDSIGPTTGESGDVFYDLEINRSAADPFVGGYYNFQVYFDIDGGVSEFDFSNVSSDYAVYSGFGDQLPGNILGGAGDDSLGGNSAANELTGNDGSDVLSGGDGNDLLSGGVGDDFILGDGVGTNAPGNDELLGGPGNDFLIGDDPSGASTSGGADILSGGADNDMLYGGFGADELNGGDGIDVLRGDLLSPQLLGDFGNDVLNGDGADDLLYGDPGDDILNGGDANDALIGNDGLDTLRGDDGNDFLFGDDNFLPEEAITNRVDQLMGGPGNDILVAGQGADILTGDAGRDRFLFAEDTDLDTGFVINDPEEGPIPQFINTGTNVSPTFSEDATNEQSTVADFSKGEDLIVFPTVDSFLDPPNEIPAYQFNENGTDVTFAFGTFGSGFFSSQSFTFADLTTALSSSDVLIHVAQSETRYRQDLSVSFLDDNSVSITDTGSHEAVYSDASQSNAIDIGDGFDNRIDVFDDVQLNAVVTSGVTTGGQDKFDFTGFGFSDEQIADILFNTVDSFLLDDLQFDSSPEVIDLASKFFIDEASDIARAVRVEYFNGDGDSLAVYVDADMDGAYDLELDLAFEISNPLGANGNPYAFSGTSVTAADIYNDPAGDGSGTGIFIFNEDQYNLWYNNPEPPVLPPEVG